MSAKPDDITRREAARVFAFLEAGDTESMEAYLHLERRDAASRVEWVGTFIGAVVFGGIVAMGCMFATWIYADVALGVKAADARAAATEARAEVVEERCMERIVCEMEATP